MMLDRNLLFAKIEASAPMAASEGAVPFTDGSEDDRSLGTTRSDIGEEPK